jgi:O-antigen ligase
MRMVCVGLTLVLLAMQSYGAAILLLGVFAVIGFCRLTNQRWPLMLLLMVPLGWVAGRVTGVIDSQSLVSVMSFANERRVASFAYRLHTEDVLIDNTWQQPFAGLGSWGNDRTIELDYIQTYVVVDGFWVLAFSRYGFIGLLAFLMIFFVPAYSVLRRTKPRDWTMRPDHGISAALALVLTIVAIDNLMNAMFNPLWILIAGALVNLRGRPESEGAPSQPALASSGAYTHVLGQPRS